MSHETGVNATFVNLTYVLRSACVALLCTMPVINAAPLFTVQTLAYQGKMPYIVADDARLAQRINNVIYLDVLELAPPVRLQDGLKYTGPDGSVSSVSNVTFKVSRNDPTLLVLSLEYEWCGAYCENNTAHFNFESATGRHVVASELFTRSGQAAVGRRVDAMQAAQWRAQIVKLRKQLKGALPPPAKLKKTTDLDDTTDNLESAAFMYETCLKQIKRKKTDPERDSKLSSMRIGGDSVSFVRDRCSNHAGRALDALDKISVTLAFSELAPHLSGYGKYLLLKAERVGPTGGLFGQVLFGQIGSLPITLRLNEHWPKQSPSARYYYDRFRTPIDLSGEWVDDALLFREPELNGKAGAEITAIYGADALTGFWIKGDKKLAFKVTR